MQPKYQVLRVISWFYRILAVLLILGGVVVLILLASDRNQGLTTGILALMGCVVLAVILFGLVELFQLFIDVEENTRATVAINRQLAKALSEKR